jgi:hypothetical protein
MAELTQKPPDGIFGTKAGSKLCKLPSKEDTGTSSQIPKIVYVRYRDHVIFRNLAEAPPVEAVVRETLGWVKCENDEVLLIEHDRATSKGSVGFNGIIVLKNCVISLLEVPLQLFSNMSLNCTSSKEETEYALQTTTTKRKTHKNGRDEKYKR